MFFEESWIGSGGGAWYCAFAGVGLPRLGVMTIVGLETILSFETLFGHSIFAADFSFWFSFLRAKFSLSTLSIWLAGYG